MDGQKDVKQHMEAGSVSYIGFLRICSHGLFQNDAQTFHPLIFVFIWSYCGLQLDPLAEFLKLSVSQGDLLFPYCDFEFLVHDSLVSFLF